MGNFEHRRNDRPRNSGFRSDRPREMHDAVCDECKKKCQVPFKPTEGKPVYCKECFAKRNQR